VEVVAALALAPVVVEAAVEAVVVVAAAVVAAVAALALAPVSDLQRSDKPDRRKAVRR
jgi:hypothetical protein